LQSISLAHLGFFLYAWNIVIASRELGEVSPNEMTPRRRGVIYETESTSAEVYRPRNDIYVLRKVCVCEGLAEDVLK
jgi:hypothetical protein